MATRILASSIMKTMSELMRIRVEVRYEAAKTPWVLTCILDSRNLTAFARSRSSLLPPNVEKGGIRALKLQSRSYITVSFLY
jgi:hypothetical protein